MDRYGMKLTGVSPLLMHFDNIAAQDAENVKGKQGGKAGDDRYPADHWKSYLYIDDKRVVMPSANLLSSLLKVGSAISIGGKKTLKAASTGVGFVDVYLDFKAGASLKPILRVDVEAIKGVFAEQARQVHSLGFEILVCPCTVNGKRHIRTRPMFNIWTVEGEFIAADPDLTEPRLVELFTLAGLKSGLGDWRPGAPKKPGPYGKFKAELKLI